MSFRSDASFPERNLEDEPMPSVRKPYDCDGCGERAPCCLARNTPHGDGSFCHRCRGEKDYECDVCQPDEVDEAYERMAARDRLDGFARTGGRDWT